MTTVVHLGFYLVQQHFIRICTRLDLMYYMILFFLSSVSLWLLHSNIHHC